MIGVDLVGSRRIEPAHVGCLVSPDGSRRLQSELRLTERPGHGAELADEAAIDGFSPSIAVGDKFPSEAWADGRSVVV
jgi:hypothetical protein